MPVFLLSLKAGGTGLTLTRATHVLHYDRWWNPAVEDQATDRAYRIGQDRPVQVHRLIAEGTLEDRIAALLGYQTRAGRRRRRLRRGLDRRAVRRRARRAGQPAGGVMTAARCARRARPHVVGPGMGGGAGAAGAARPQPAAARPGLRRAAARSATLAAGARGEARAQVQGRRIEPYRGPDPASGGSPTRSGTGCSTAISARLGHAAALLDGELPPEIAEDAARAGLDLLPGAGEVGPRCTCPDDADPCKHSAAVCYLVADALDADPFALLLLRGRTRGEVLAGLRARRRGLAAAQPAASGQGGALGVARALDGGTPGGAPDGSSHAPADPGVDARVVLLSGAAPGPVPVPPLRAARPGHPASAPDGPARLARRAP